MRHTINIFVLLGIIWLTNSGMFSTLPLLLGLASIVFVVWLGHKMDVVDQEAQPFHLTARLPAFYWWLFKKLLQANVDVVKHVWRPVLAITPCTATVKASQQSDMGKVIYANSITLTPGTVALDLKADTIVVHSLTREGLEDLQTGEMDRQISLLES